MKEDNEWLEYIGREECRFHKNCEYLVGKWFVFANLKGIFVKKIAKVWGHEGTDYALEFEDESRVYVDINDMERLIEYGSYENHMWLFNNYDDIHFNETARKEYFDALHDIERAKKAVRKLEDKIENFQSQLLIGVKTDVEDD